MQIAILPVDYHNPTQAEELVELLDMYARDPMGGGVPLDPQVRAMVVEKLAASGIAFSLIAYVDGQAAGLVNCVEGFSTFAAKPLINIHDVAVAPGFRGLGLSQQLLSAVETIARERGCCKVTLEVLQGNQVAQAAYRKAGYAGYALDPDKGDALFWQKTL